ncbi:MAG: hypothetical protein AAB414_02710 [Patescibacteria group bacterium]
MITFIQLFFNFLIFIALSLFVLYLPGFGMIARKKEILKDQETVVLSISLGIVFFVGFAIIFSLLNIRWLMLPIFIFYGLYVFAKYKLEILKPWKVFIKDKLLLILIVLGILTQGFINFPSGLLYKEGLLFWSSQGHDGIWHISLMGEIKKSLPPNNPTFAGEKLYNYHYLVDVLMGEFARIFPYFSSLDLYFRFFPVIFSFLIGASVFAFVTKWKNNIKIGYFGVFFTYFVGSFGYIVTWLRDGNLFGGETVFWASQENTLLGNPPHAVAHVFLTTFLLSLLFYLKERKFYWLIILFILGSMLTGFKVSGGFVMLTGIGAAAISDLIFNKKVHIILLAFALVISNVLTFKAMTSSQASSFLMFLPWWFIRTMIVDKLGWIDHELRRQHYLSKGTWNAYLRVIQLEITALLIFLIGNLGMRILGFYILVRNGLKMSFLKNPVSVMLLVSMLTGFFMVILFVQKGIIYNNIQFIQYSLLISGFYGAVAAYQLLILIKRKLPRLILFSLIVFLSVPTVIGNLNEFYGPSKTALAKISNQQLEALKFLRENSMEYEVVLTVPFNKYLKDQFIIQPRPIYAWYPTSYIPALTGRKTYLTSEEQALITGYPTDERLNNMKKFFEQSNPLFNKRFLKEENIRYIYTSKDELISALDLDKNNLDIFFENSEVIIYKVL